jgi:hypothetical protein
MLDCEGLKVALDLIENDKSKVLGLTVGSRKAEPGEYIPRAGQVSRSVIAQRFDTYELCV